MIDFRKVVLIRNKLTGGKDKGIEESRMAL